MEYTAKQIENAKEIFELQGSGIVSDSELADQMQSTVEYIVKHGPPALLKWLVEDAETVA